MSITSRGARVGIVGGGGPAPGINGTIGAVTLEAGNRGCQASTEKYAISS
jgi:6-phosphofructokinase